LPLPFDLAMSTLVTLSHFVPHVQPRLVVWLFWWEHCCPSLSTWRCRLRHTIPLCPFTPPLAGQDTVFARSRSKGRRPWSYTPDLPLRRRPLRTIRPPPPTVFTELQWGERHRGAFGTCARVAGSFSISVWSVLLPSVATVSTRRLWTVNLEMATFQIRGTRGRAGVASLSIGSWSWNDTPYVEVSYGFAFRSTSTQIASQRSPRPGQNLRPGGLGAILRTFPSAVAL
jgi:hypothetical protein